MLKQIASEARARLILKGRAFHLNTWWSAMKHEARVYFEARIVALVFCGSVHNNKVPNAVRDISYDMFNKQNI